MHAVAGVAVEDMKHDALGRRGGGIQRDRARHLTNLQNAFQFARAAMAIASSRTNACLTFREARVFLMLVTVNMFSRPAVADQRRRRCKARFLPLGFLRC